MFKKTDAAAKYHRFYGEIELVQKIVLQKVRIGLRTAQYRDCRIGLKYGFQISSARIHVEELIALALCRCNRAGEHNAIPLGEWLLGGLKGVVAHHDHVRRV